MLVEPLLPRAWRKELDKQKILKNDAETDLYATGIAEQDTAQAPEEEGSPLQDDFIALEGPMCPSRCKKSQMLWTLFL